MAVTGVDGRNPPHTGASEGPPHPTMPSECAVPFLFLLVSRIFFVSRLDSRSILLLHPKLLVPVETISTVSECRNTHKREGYVDADGAKKKNLKCYERNCATETLTMLQSGKLSLVLVVDDLFVVDDAAAPCDCRRPQRKSRLTDSQWCLFSRSRGRRQSEEKKRRRPPPATAEAARGTGGRRVCFGTPTQHSRQRASVRPKTSRRTVRHFYSSAAAARARRAVRSQGSQERRWGAR